MSMRIAYLIGIIGVASIGVDRALAQSNASVTVHVKDPDGRPIANASAGVAFEVPKESGLGTRPDSKEGLTDETGLFVASGSTSSPLVSYGAEKKGFYLTTNLKMEFDRKEGGRWQPWNPTLEVVLKPIVRPIPMYAKCARVEVPDVGKPIGYDLIMSDWVAPYGAGKVSDFLFEVSRQFVSRNDFDCSLTVTFSNKGDGLHQIRVPGRVVQGSRLRLPYLAPENGYESKIVSRISKTPTGPQVQDAQEDMNYFFRVRTKHDSGGNITSTQYGKIHGDFRLYPTDSKTCLVVFTYYLNPTANDQNVEFDTARNLFGELPPLEHVSRP